MKRAAFIVAIVVAAIILLLFLRARVRADQAAAASASAAWSSLLNADDRKHLPTEDDNESPDAAVTSDATAPHL